MPSPNVFAVHGDLCQIEADALVFSTDSVFTPGRLTKSFQNVFRDFDLRLRHVGADRRGPGVACWLGELPRHTGGATHVVVTISVDGVTDEPWPSAELVATSIRCATRGLQSAGERRRRLIAFPSLLSGDGGRQDERRALAREQIRAAQSAVAGHDDLDVAFVLHDRSTYEVYLAALREAGDGGQDGPAVPLELAAAIRDRRAVVFVGSGLSRSLPSWEELTATLLGRLKTPHAEELARSTEDYLVAADWYDWVATRVAQPALKEIVRDTYGRARTAGSLPTLAHYQLLSLPFRYIVTTNFDPLLERALEAQKRRPQIVVRDGGVPHTAGVDDACIVKLHGDADDEGPIVLTKSQYDQFFEDHPAKALLLEGLLLNHVFLFVGYSLSDPHLRQIHGRIAAMLQAQKLPAYMTAFSNEPAGEELAGITRIPFHGNPVALRRWLGRLVLAATPPASTFLADASPPDGSQLHDLHAQLRNVGDCLPTLARRPLGHDDALALARLAECMAELAWRVPDGMEQLWADLAAALPDGAVRRRCGARAGLPDDEMLRTRTAAAPPPPRASAAAAPSAQRRAPTPRGHARHARSPRHRPS
ncbi:MAG TPA: SIR2 family protein [Polyangia bacterium]